MDPFVASLQKQILILLTFSPWIIIIWFGVFNLSYELNPDVKFLFSISCFSSLYFAIG
jgi:hypothetical protein